MNAQPFSQHLHMSLNDHYIRAGHTIYKATAVKTYQNDSFKPTFTLENIQKLNIKKADTYLGMELRNAPKTDLTSDELAQKKWLHSALLNEVRHAEYVAYRRRKHIAKLDFKCRQSRSKIYKAFHAQQRAELEAQCAGYGV